MKQKYCSQILFMENIDAQLSVETALASTLFDLQNVLTVLSQSFPDNVNLVTASDALQAAALAFINTFCK